MEVVLRHPGPDEIGLVKSLVQAVVDKTYGTWASSPLAADNEDWSLAWIAISDAQPVGVVLTHEEWISDLWVLAKYQGRGVGRMLLGKAESEISARGHQTFYLRVVKSNTRALKFYQQTGWRVKREFPHETLPTMMLEMLKEADRC